MAPASKTPLVPQEADVITISSAIRAPPHSDELDEDVVKKG
jgi:hypothetical protein